MKLINLEEFVILGPGSEWLWTMISGIVLAVTFVAIYRQLRLQRAAASIEQVRAIYREWTEEGMARAKLEALGLIRDGAPAKAILQAGVDIGDFWEGFAYLVRAGNIDRKLIYNALGPAVRTWWGLLEPAARVARDEADDQGVWIDFEWLSGVFAEFDRIAGEPAAYDAAYLTRRLPDLVETNRHAIQRYEELRAVIIRSASTTSLDAGAGHAPRRSRKRPARQGV